MVSEPTYGSTIVEINWRSNSTRVFIAVTSLFAAFFGADLHFFRFVQVWHLLLPNYRFLLEASAIALLSIAKKPQKEEFIPAFFLSLAAFLQAIPAFLVFEASYGLSTSLSTLPTHPLQCLLAGGGGFCKGNLCCIFSSPSRGSSWLNFQPSSTSFHCLHGACSSTTTGSLIGDLFDGQK